MASGDCTLLHPFSWRGLFFSVYAIFESNNTLKGAILVSVTIKAWFERCTGGVFIRYLNSVRG